MLIGFMLSRNETEQPQHLNASRVLISCESTSIMNSTDAWFADFVAGLSKLFILDNYFNPISRWRKL